MMLKPQTILGGTRW